MSSREILMDPILFTYSSSPGESYQATSGNRYGKSPADIAQTTDEYFKGEPETAPLGHIVDELVDHLPERQRLCIQLRVFARMPYSQIARRLDFYCGDPPYPNKKKAWRSVQRALDALRDSLTDLPPRQQLLVGHLIPDTEDDE